MRHFLLTFYDQFKHIFDDIQNQFIPIITLKYSLKMFKNTSCSNFYNIFIFIEVSNNIRTSYILNI